MYLAEQEQTIHGGDEEAIAVAEGIKADGVDIISLSLGEANVYTMESMASLPVAIYSRQAETVEHRVERAALQRDSSPRSPHPRLHYRRRRPRSRRAPPLARPC